MFTEQECELDDGVYERAGKFEHDVEANAYTGSDRADYENNRDWDNLRMTVGMTTAITAGDDDDLSLG